nr:retrotransposable element Tf2 [Tanacetum cinerariifolium]
MAPATRSIAGTSNNEDGGVNERLKSLEESLAQVIKAMQEMVTMNQGGNGNGRNQNQNQFTRMTKVEFPKFSGDDVKGWIFRCEQFFSIDEILENQKRFGTVYDDPISEIRKVKYQTNAKEYQDAFDTLLSRVDISEEHAVSFILVGQSSSSKPSLLGLPASNSSWKPKPNTPLTTPVKKQLTQKEYQEKRAQNLCFYCDQKYTPGHKCSGQLYLVMVVPKEEEFFEVVEGMEDTVEQQFFAKMSKCVFGTTHVEYLGHVILSKGVSTDPSKIKAMQEWPIPSNLKQLRGLLGLRGYYRRFIKGFASLSILLTQFLKKNAFKWIPKAQDSFKELKKEMIEAPVLGLPDFNEPFIFGYDYEVVYKKGSDNGATDSFSRLENASELPSMFISSITTDLMQRVRSTWVIDNAVLDIITTLQSGQLAKKHYSWANSTLLRKVVDMLSKYANFVGLSHPFTASYIAQVFLDSIYKLHGLPESIMSDKEKPHRQVTIRQGKQHKFSQKFYGPFKIIAKVEQVAYKLKLPAQAQIHNVFHISQSNKYRGPPVSMDSMMLPQCDKEGTLLKKPLKLLDRRIARKEIELWCMDCGGCSDFCGVTMGSFRSKEDDVAKISTSVFVTNFPESFSAEDLFQSCKQYGHVVDTFIPNKRSKAGRINLRRNSVTGFPAQSNSSSNTITLDSPHLLVLNTEASQSRQHGFRSCTSRSRYWSISKLTTR